METKINKETIISNNYPTLSDEETRENIRRYRAGDKKAGEYVANGNMRLVFGTLSEMSIDYNEYDDLVQAGRIGLYRAINNFTLSRKICFSTCAVTYIKRAIFRYNRSVHKYRTIRGHKELLEKVSKLEKKLTIENGKKPTMVEIAKVLKIQPGQIERALILTQDVISLYTNIGSADDETVLLDCLPDNHDQISGLIDALFLKEAYERLDDREKEMIYRKYYLNEKDYEIATAMGNPKTNITREFKKIYSKMKSEFNPK